MLEETITSSHLMQHYDSFSPLTGSLDETGSPHGRSRTIPPSDSSGAQPDHSSTAGHRRAQSIDAAGLMGLQSLDTPSINMNMDLPPSKPREHRRAQSIDDRLGGLQSLLDSMDMDLPPPSSQPTTSKRRHRRIHSEIDCELLNPIGIPEPYMSKEDTKLQQSEGPRFMDATTPMMMEDVTAFINVTGALEVSPRNRISTEDSVNSIVSAVDIDWKIPFKGMLYDRSEERTNLFQAYRRIQLMEEDELDCILISGPCGTGKTYLAKSLKSPVEMDGGYFLMGKFDQLQRPEPFRAFKAAFTYFTKLVLQKDAQVVATMRDSILRAVGHEMGVLTAVIPAIRKIVGSTGECTPHVAGDPLCRFAYVMRMFMRAVCSCEHPVVLFFDDLHWADNCSLDLLRILISDTECKGLVFVGTCLDSVSPTSNLSTALCKLEDENRARITNITVGNLNPEMLRYIISETFHLSEEHCSLLCGIIFHQTDGNMMYVMEFMTWLENERLLKYNQRTWKWDEQETSLTIECNKIGDFLLDKLERLPHDVQEVLRVASCLGSSIDEDLMNLLMERDVGELLSCAADKDVILIQQEEYQFPTDGVQRAAYSMIPVDERESFHLSLGRQLLKVLDKQQLEENLFTVLSQMKIGGRLITSNTEKRAISMVCLHAGKVAAQSSAFLAAAEYLAFGISLLSERRWLGDETDLTLALYNAAAEVELCRSNFTRLDELIEDILSNTRRTDEQLQAQCTKIYALGVRYRQEEAIDLGIEILKSVGETFPSRLCMAHLMGEMKGVERLLRGKEDEQLLRQPFMTDFKRQMAMRILNIISLDCWLSRPSFAPYVKLKMVSLTMRHGLSEHASAAFAM
jgi:predicted ATPase